jgi:hypothetical protein
MLAATLAACAVLTLLVILAVPRAAETRCLARLRAAQEKWAEAQDRNGLTP